MIAMRSPIPGCLFASSLGDRQQPFQLLPNLLGIDVRRVGTRVFKTKPELRWAEQIWLVGHVAARAITLPTVAAREWRVQQCRAKKIGSVFVESLWGAV